MNNRFQMLSLADTLLDHQFRCEPNKRLKNSFEHLKTNEKS